jgi:hypothetical protein
LEFDGTYLNGYLNGLKVLAANAGLPSMDSTWKWAGWGVNDPSFTTYVMPTMAITQVT